MNIKIAILSAILLASAGAAEPYVKVNGAFSRHVAGGVGTNLYGGELAGGLNFGRSAVGHWDAGVSAGYLRSPGSYITVYDTTIAQQIETIPVLGNLNYNFALSKSGNTTFFIGGYAGGYYVKNTLSTSEIKISGDGLTWSAGANLGFNINLFKNCDLVLSGSAGKIGAVELDYGNGISDKIDSGVVYTGRAGIKFRF